MTTDQQNQTDKGTAKRTVTLVEHELPSYWASYLINGDDSGIDGKDQYEADKFLAEHNLPSPVSCEPVGIGRFNGLMCDLETYSFLILSGEPFDNSLDGEGEARVRALAESEARKAQLTFEQIKHEHDLDGQTNP